MRILEDTYKEGVEILSSHDIEDAKIDAWYLMEFVFHITRVEYYMNTKKTIEDDSYYKYIEVISKRANHTPLQYITGVTEFMGMEFFVSPDVLIPRQDTECLVSEVLKYSENKSVLDMCTGSSCIITSLSKLCNLSEAVGVDISEKALLIAAKNIKNLNANVELIQSDLFDKINKRFDIIVSNPPYIKSSIVKDLMIEVKEYEPLIALDGMEDGLYFYRKIINEAKSYLKENGMIFFEIGHDQGNEVSELLEESNFKSIQVVKDLAGLDRIVYSKL